MSVSLQILSNHNLPFGSAAVLTDAFEQRVKAKVFIEKYADEKGDVEILVPHGYIGWTTNYYSRESDIENHFKINNSLCIRHTDGTMLVFGRYCFKGLTISFSRRWDDLLLAIVEDNGKGIDSMDELNFELNCFRTEAAIFGGDTLVLSCDPTDAFLDKGLYEDHTIDEVITALKEEFFVIEYEKLFKVKDVPVLHNESSTRWIVLVSKKDVKLRYEDG